MMETEVEKLLRTAAAAPLPVPEGLMARILADAAREQPRFAGLAPKGIGSAPAALPALGLWDMLSGLFGGGGVLAGMASVACAGIYLGAAQPAVVSDLTLALAGTAAVDQLDFMPSIDAILAEE